MRMHYGTSLIENMVFVANSELIKKYDLERGVL